MPYVSLQSLNYPDRFVRHQNSLGELHPVSSDLDKSDATFWIPDPLQWNVPVILRSANYPARVFRHFNFRLRLDKFNPPLERSLTPEEDQVRKDATFILTHGLADPEDPGLVSFRSINFEDRYIRHADFHLWVHAMGEDQELFRRDATFRLKSPFVTPPPNVR